MLEKIKAINNEIHDIIMKKEFQISDCNISEYAKKKELSTKMKFEDIETVIRCDEDGNIWGYIVNVSIGDCFTREEQRELSKYLFCESLSILNEKNKQQIECLGQIINKL